jgi:hypothetical protein
MPDFCCLSEFEDGIVGIATLVQLSAPGCVSSGRMTLVVFCFVILRAYAGGWDERVMKEDEFEGGRSDGDVLSWRTRTSDEVQQHAYLSRNGKYLPTD